MNVARRLDPPPRRFAEDYARLRAHGPIAARERADSCPEDLVQAIWYDQLIRADGLCTTDGRALKVISPGWWNRGEGPDFRGAQIEFNGRLRTGDVEIHVDPADWRRHGHAMDARYDGLILHVTLDGDADDAAVLTSDGKQVPALVLRPYLEQDLADLAERFEAEPLHGVEGTFGKCAALVEAYGAGQMLPLLHLAGEWRMLFKARVLRDRMDRAGADQAVYEAVLTACGFAHFKHHFQVVARSLPYDRARQLAREDAMLLEAALLQISGLLPTSLPEGTTAVPHFARLRGLRNDRLDGLRALPLEWKRVGVRPINYPERRMAGAAQLVSKTVAQGLVTAIDDIWGMDAKPMAIRKEFEKLFPGAAMGFWASHCTWTGKKMDRAAAPIGAGRVRSIIGNVFIPLGLGLARQRRDRVREERVLDFFAALPREPDNHIQELMLPRLFGTGPKPNLDFRTQQGLIQMFRDWCEPNPSCRNCSVVRSLIPRRDAGRS